jgi:sulfatase modifying factor 1
MRVGGRMGLGAAAIGWSAFALGCELAFPLSDRFTAGNGSDAAVGDAGAEAADGGTVTPPSCAPGGAGLTTCGSGSASCCASLPVTGGNYYRGYDGISFTSMAYPAMVSGFRLDQYEVTVGRFRQFVNALVAGWMPAAGSGKHAHLNAGHGLNATGGGYEGGWDASWTPDLATTASGWNMNLAGGTWTAVASNENLPITREDWYEAYAFCIWDGGFLPSEAEWDYAAAGGTEQRAYPWSRPFPPGSTTLSCTEANYLGCTAAVANAVGSDSPAGDGKWNQSDLAGNAWEWVLDVRALDDAGSATYVNPCTDCVDLTSSTARTFRGGGFNASAASQLTSSISYQVPTFRLDDLGVRCARAP